MSLMKWPLVITLIGCSTLLAGCGSNDIDRRPCAEQIPCPQPITNSCEEKDISPARWTSLGLEDENVTAIAAHPCNPGIIYAGTQFNFSAGTQGKLLKTTDCGTSWDTLAVGGSYRTIQLAPGNPDVVYAVNGSILKSTDAGQSWQQAGDGINLDAETGVGTLAINPQNACMLYAGTSGFYGGDLYKSADGAESWQLIEGKGLEDLGDNMNSLDGGVSSLAINPINPDHLYTGTVQTADVLRSTDGGATWKPTGLVSVGLVHSLLIDPTGSLRVFAGINRKGLHKTDDAGASWKVVTNEFLTDTTSVVELEMDPQNEVLYVATTYGESGRLLAYDIPDDRWYELPAPVTDQSFYYSKLTIQVINNKMYKLFGTSGLYVQAGQ